MNFPRPDTAAERTEVSIIIPALNEEKVIGTCLRSLADLDAARDSFEVILVDNGSTDRTVEIARSFSTTLNLTVLEKPGVHISALRNLGAARARHPILAFLDADCVAPSTWLAESAGLLARPGVGAVGAHYLIPSESGWVARAWYGHLNSEKQGDLVWLPSGDLFVTRSTFSRLGGFDESIETNEDCEFCGRVRASGLRVVGDSSLAVVHLGTPQTLAGFYRKIRWHGTDGLRVFLREFPSMSFAGPLLFALYTVFCLAGLGIGAVLALGRWNPKIFTLFLIALILPSLLLSTRLALRRKKWNDLLPLTVLYLTYGMARARALFEIGNREPRRGRQTATIEGPA